MLHGRGVRVGKRRSVSHIGDKDASKVGGIMRGEQVTFFVASKCRARVHNDRRLSTE